MRHLRGFAALLAATLKEIFDETAYARFLARKAKAPSAEAYAEFVQEKHSAPVRRCC